MNNIKDFQHYIKTCKTHKVALEKLMAKDSIKVLSEAYQDLFKHFRSEGFASLEEASREYKFSEEAVLETYAMGLLIENVIELIKKRELL